MESYQLKKRLVPDLNLVQVMDIQTATNSFNRILLVMDRHPIPVMENQTAADLKQSKKKLKL